MQQERQLEALALHVQELRRLNALLEQDNASVRQQLARSANDSRLAESKLRQTSEELRVSKALVQDLRSRLSQRDNDALYAQDLLRKEKREHQLTRERVQELLAVYDFLIQQREALDAERDELDTEREELDAEKAELEEAKEDLEEAQEKLEEEQEELEEEQEQLEADQQELEDEKEELEAEREEMGEEMEAWRQRSKQLEKRIEVLSALLPSVDVEAVKRANPVCPEPGANVRPTKRKTAAGRSSKSRKKARK